MSGYKPTNGRAADGEEAASAWKSMMDIAASAGFIVQAYGGVATVAMPEEQRKAGIRNKVLRTSLFELEDE